MRCAACGFDNPSGTRYCGSCGATIGASCPSCRAVNPPEFRFCGSCGARLEHPTAEAPGEERKVVTVLFADLVGFTDRAERLDPEDVRGVLSPYYERLRREIERFGGTVEKFIGDAVMALFGAPVAHEDDPERAVRAALAIREAIGELNEANPALDLHARIAVATGEAVVTLSARPSEGEGMAAGDVVNTAARLQQAAPVDGILAADMTYRATDHAIEYEAADSVHAKGKAEPVAAWEAIGPRARLGVDVVQRGGARLVGRDAELKVVRDAFDRARDARCSQLVTLVGGPGIGKSRLVWELFTALTRDADPKLIFWRQGRSLPYGEGVTYWALAEIAKAQAGILETDSAEVAEAKLREAVRSLFADGREARWVESALRPLVGLGRDEASGAEERTETFAAWRRFFEALAERRPLVLVFEDLHWANDGLLEFVDYLVDWTTDVPLFVVATARPELLERKPDWGGGKTNAATISLAPLSDEAIAELVAELLGHRERDGVADQILAQAGGNPLYAEEYVRMLLDPARRAESPLPESVRGIIAARLDALPPDEKLLLQDAAVVGKTFWVGALTTIGDVPRWAVEERLTRLVRKEFVRRERRSSVGGESQYAFRHGLVRDVAYGQIARARRAEKHRLGAEWIESLAADRPEDHAEMLAYHYGRAVEFARAAGRETDELRDRARLALREAGDRAAALHAFGAASRFYADALELWPDDGERPYVLFRYGRALFECEDAGADVLTEARDALLARGDRELAAEAEEMVGELAWIRGRRDAAFASFRRASAMVADAPASRSKVYVLSNLARFLMTADENEQAIEVGREALAMADALSLDEFRSHVLATIGVSRVTTGDLDGRGDLEQSIEIANAIGSPLVIRGYNNLASTEASLGNLAHAAELYAAGRRAAERFGHARALRWFTVEEIRQDYLRAHWEDALAAADQELDTVEGGEPYLMSVDVRVVRALIRLARGDTAGALDDSAKGVILAREAKDPQLLFPALACRSRVLASAGETEEAAIVATELLDRWTVTGTSLVSLWLADFAFALHSLGRGPDLVEAAATARTRTRWVDAAVAFCADELDRAADVYAEIGSLPDEACARLCAAESRIAVGDGGAETGTALTRALELSRLLGASAYVERAEALLATVETPRRGAVR